MSQLHIPDVARAVALNVYDHLPTNLDTSLLAAVEAAAPYIVAAELRRLAEEWGDIDWLVAQLDARADELDGGAA